MSVVFMYPGQGSQAPGMGAFLAEQFPYTRQVIEEASDQLRIDMQQLLFKSSTEDLQQTVNTQPALLTVSTMAGVALKKELGLKASHVLGHSVGEYAALVEAEALSFADAILAVRQRGKAMQDAVPRGFGGMVACLGPTPLEVEKLCSITREQTGLVLEPANFNCPGQIVLSGHLKAITWLQGAPWAELWPERPQRMKFITLAVSAPFHCSMMRPAEEQMAVVIRGLAWRDSKIPVLQNVDAEFHSKSADLMTNLIHQISQPVRWTQSLEKLAVSGLTRLIEVGHGKVLSGLCKKIDSAQFQVFNTATLEDFKLIESQKNSMG